jgi:hypothetical protein
MSAVVGRLPLLVGLGLRDAAVVAPRLCFCIREIETTTRGSVAHGWARLQLGHLVRVESKGRPRSVLGAYAVARACDTSSAPRAAMHNVTREDGSTSLAGQRRPIQTARRFPTPSGAVRPSSVDGKARTRDNPAISALRRSLVSRRTTTVVLRFTSPSGYRTIPSAPHP